LIFQSYLNFEIVVARGQNSNFYSNGVFNLTTTAKQQQNNNIKTTTSKQQQHKVQTKELF
jgi:hypothetical protein